jgi:hypothetical protein
MSTRRRLMPMKKTIEDMQREINYMSVEYGLGIDRARGLAALSDLVLVTGKAVDPALILTVGHMGTVVMKAMSGGDPAVETKILKASIWLLLEGKKYEDTGSQVQGTDGNRKDRLPGVQSQGGNAARGNGEAEEKNQGV